MNLRQIEVFRAVMLAGSVTDAAKVLHVSQPGISRMLGHIELQLGVRLFERGRGKLRPTPEAHALHAEVEQVYRGVQSIGQRARELKSGAGLTLRILSSPGPALEVVPQVVATLATRFPAARFYLETQLVREMVGQLVRHEADIAVSTLAIDHAMLSQETVGDWTLVCAFGTGHDFESRRSIGARDLAPQRIIAFSADTPQGRLVEDLWLKLGRRPQSQIEVRSGQVACALAACGAGVAVVDDLTARAWRNNNLRFRPLAKAPSHSIFVVRNSAFAASKLAGAFTEGIRTSLRSLSRVVGVA
jgi:DNA-binding transcriptional LysR family regulator